jgi:hypothetical protein
MRPHLIDVLTRRDRWIRRRATCYGTAVSLIVRHADLPGIFHDMPLVVVTDPRSPRQVTRSY